MEQDEVHAVLDALGTAGIPTWVAGGWGVDALAGRQTRAHRDLDLLVDAERLEDCLSILTARGYAVETDWLPVRVEVGAAGRGWVDVHPVRLAADGSGGQAGRDGTLKKPPPERPRPRRRADVRVQPARRGIPTGWNGQS